MTRSTEKLIHAALRDGCREHCDALIDELRRLKVQLAASEDQAERLRAQRDALLEALEGGADSWQRVGPAIDALKAALAEPDSDSPERRCGGPGCDGTCCQPVQEPQGCAHCNHPLYAAIKCRVCGRVTEPTPPQRKPLAEWQINDLMADIDPEDRDSWSFRQGVYAAEKHHGVRK